MSQTEMARALGISRQRVSQLCAKLGVTGAMPAVKREAAKRRARVVEMALAGCCTADIAREVGLSEDRVSAIRASEGIPVPEMTPEAPVRERLSAIPRERIEAEVRAHGYVVAAERLAGCSAMALHRYCRERGWLSDLYRGRSLPRDQQPHATT
jgi:hypothetical protein